MLIGVDTRDSLQLLRSVESGLPYRAFEQLRANTSMSSDAALALVGIPKRTLTRRRREGRFRQDESDRLVRAARIFGRALSLFDGNLERATDWLSRSQKALGGGVPLEMARTEVGSIEVERVLGRLEHGVFT
jgi:putative toxin-antitoxin system antitoxin component (TIGR02293 family)